jgi:thiosulfate dehydrogenase
MRGLAFGLSCIAALGSGAVIAKGAAPVGPASRAHGAAPAAATVCQGCHGAHGEGNPAARIPRLAGQAADYLEKELRDYASGARRNEIMQNFAKPLSDADRGAIAAYFASQKAAYAKVEPGATDTQLARGHQLAHQGSEAERIQACNNCHGPEGIGEPHSAPYLAGQSAGYLAAELQWWRQGVRKNDAGKLMSSVAERLSDQDVAAVSAYYESLGAAQGPVTN